MQIRLAAERKLITMLKNAMEARSKATLMSAVQAAKCQFAALRAPLCFQADHHVMHAAGSRHPSSAALLRPSSCLVRVFFILSSAL